MLLSLQRISANDWAGGRAFLHAESINPEWEIKQLTPPKRGSKLSGTVTVSHSEQAYTALFLNRATIPKEWHSAAPGTATLAERAGSNAMRHPDIAGENLGTCWHILLNADADRQASTTSLNLIRGTSS